MRTIRTSSGTLAALLTLVLAVGCGGGDDDGLVEPPANHPILEISWVATSLTVVGEPDAGDAVIDLGLQFSFYFENDGEYGYLANGDDPQDPWICESGASSCQDWGTFRISGDRIVMDEGTVDAATYAYSIAGDVLTMTDVADGGFKIVAER